MALKPTSRWQEAAAAGTAEPVLLFEFKPTVLYSEKNSRADWADYLSNSNLDTSHPTDELRLRKNREVVHPEKQTDQSREFHPVLYLQYFSTSHVMTNAPRAGMVQTFRVGPSFRLKKLYLGIKNEAAFNEELYRGKIRLRIVRGVDRPVGKEDLQGGRESYIESLLAKAREIASAEIDFQDIGTGDAVVDSDGIWQVIDFSRENIWVPGGNETCAMVLEPLDSFHLASVKVLGSSSAEKYQRGNLYLYDPETGRYRRAEGDLSFKFIADGYPKSGSGIWSFDLGEKPSGELEGEVQLRYCEPPGTRVTFKMKEGDTLSQAFSQRRWSIISDGSRVSKRFVLIEPVLEADQNQIDTPRIYSMRVAFRRGLKFLLASRPLFGYPNLVAEAPDYSAEGQPLSGQSQATDTSRIVLLDPAHMVSNIFSRYHLKNDEVRIFLGFDVPGFLDHSDKSYNNGLGDWLPFKAVWIEDWEPSEGRVIVHGYDQQVRFRQAQAPATDDPPEMTEKIFYDLLSPARIKRDLLARARIRPREIDYVPDALGTPLPGTSFGNLESTFNWKLCYEIDKPTPLERVDSELNRHLLAFQLVDERGKWVVRHVDFSVDFDPAEGWKKDGNPLAWIKGNHILSGSERYHPGLKYLRNYGVVFFGGKGKNETEYAEISISPGQTSAKANKEYVPDTLLSQFIPSSGDSSEAGQIAGTIARNRRILQQDGLRMVEFSTPLEWAWLQIGDHLNFTSALYKRAGSTNPNPLLVMLTRR